MYAVSVENKVYICTPGIFWLRTRGRSESEVLVFWRVLACAGSGVNRVSVDFEADMNNKLACKKQDIIDS